MPDAQVEQAAARAAAWAPWNASFAALHGWALAEGAQPDAATQAYAHALSWAPGDPLLWDEYALALARGHAFDERLLTATRQALKLAPTSPAVRTSIAEMGLAYWPQGNDELHGLWRDSLRWEVAHARETFTRRLGERGEREAFCRDHAQALGEEVWCGAKP